jgi:hypothetical protein
LLYSECGVRAPFASADLPAKRHYIKGLENKLRGAAIGPDLTLRIGMVYLKLQREHLEDCSKRGINNPTQYGARVRAQVRNHFFISKTTLQKMIDAFDEGGGTYISLRGCNSFAKARQISLTISI